MTDDPRNRRPDEGDSLGPGIVATAALAVLAIAGIAFYVVSTDRTTITATDKLPPAELRVPPQTSGQGDSTRTRPVDPDPGR
jgi:hypothetical protein